MGLFDRFFVESEDQPDEVREAVNDASYVISFSQHPYYDKFLLWIEREADKPVEIGPQVNMIQAAVRANTFKEVRDHLRRKVGEAHSTMARYREESANV